MCAYLASHSAYFEELMACHDQVLINLLKQLENVKNTEYVIAEGERLETLWTNRLETLERHVRPDLMNSYFIDKLSEVKAVLRMARFMHKLKRPGHTDKKDDTFMMDFENACLQLQAWTFDYIPQGKKRHTDPDWAKVIKSQVYPHHSDVDWFEYVAWVENGGGDEYFQE